MFFVLIPQQINEKKIIVECNTKRNFRRNQSWLKCWIVLFASTRIFVRFSAISSYRIAKKECSMNHNWWNWMQTEFNRVVVPMYRNFSFTLPCYVQKTFKIKAMLSGECCLLSTGSFFNDIACLVNFRPLSTLLWSYFLDTKERKISSTFVFRDL